jgi:Periplasmic protease
VGAGTFGKGSVQRFERTKNGQFKFTDSLYYRVNGKPTQIYGVTPDLELPALLDAEEYGEQKYKNALKPSSIESTVFYKFNNEWTSTIMKKHQARITSSDFYNLLSEIKSENESNEEVSLLFKERILIENTRKNRNLGLANLRREIAGQPKFESYQDFLDFESDGIMLDEEIDQSLQALIDIIEDKKT